MGEISVLLNFKHIAFNPLHPWYFSYMDHYACRGGLTDVLFWMCCIIEFDEHFCTLTLYLLDLCLIVKL